ncbi:MAG: hypothetical protein JJU31_11140 [Wenzhouxiangella sp.]|nr:hypothetical protein [Wenzhouxiangella sp.]MCH8479360.1 hypothetical protein [Wenzhouxiangella sp.]
MTFNASSDISSSEFRDQIVGKRISGVIARPGRNGQPPVVLMLSFDDGSVVEFVSPRSDRLLRRALRPEPGNGGLVPDLAANQLELMPMPGGMHGLN